MTEASESIPIFFLFSLSLSLSFLGGEELAGKGTHLSGQQETQNIKAFTQFSSGFAYFGDGLPVVYGTNTNNVIQNLPQLLVDHRVV